MKDKNPLVKHVTTSIKKLFTKNKFEIEGLKFFNCHSKSFLENHLSSESSIWTSQH